MGKELVDTSYRDVMRAADKYIKWVEASPQFRAGKILSFIGAALTAQTHIIGSRLDRLEPTEVNRVERETLVSALNKVHAAREALKRRNEMFDIKTVEAEAKKELAEEKSKAAKSKLKAALKRIADAEAILQNARDEYEVILRDIGK